jgi:hypothetical protein
VAGYYDLGRVVDALEDERASAGCRVYRRRGLAGAQGVWWVDYSRRFSAAGPHADVGGGQQRMSRLRQEWSAGSYLFSVKIIRED